MHNGTYSSTDVRIPTGEGGVSGATERLRIERSAATRPGADGAYTLGSGSFRWSTVYATTGAIYTSDANTSDAQEKTLLQPVPDSVRRAVRRVLAQVGVFQWLDAVEREGPACARLHVGVTTDVVRDAFIA